MSLTKLCVFNQVDEATLIPSTENAQFPVSNLKDYRRTKVFRSNTNNDSVVFDFGETVPIDSFMVVFNQKLGWGFISLTIELNGSNAWGSPAVSESITLDPIHGIGKFSWPTDQNYRYARVVMTSLIGYCELSKVFIGKAQELGDIDFEYPMQYGQNPNNVISRNRYQQRFVDKINSQKVLGGELRNMTKEEVEAVFEVLEYAGEVRPVWIYLEQTEATVNQNRLNGMYFLRTVPIPRLGLGNYWSVGMDFEEAT